MSKYLVISSDGHAGPPAAVYREYLDPEFREAFDRHQEELSAGRMVEVSSSQTVDVELNVAGQMLKQVQELTTSIKLVP